MNGIQAVSTIAQALSAKGWRVTELFGATSGIMITAKGPGDYILNVTIVEPSGNASVVMGDAAHRTIISTRVLPVADAAGMIPDLSEK